MQPLRFHDVRRSSPSRRIALGTPIGAAVLLLALLVPATTMAASLAWTRQFGTAAEDTAGGIAADKTGITVVGTTSGSLKHAVRGYTDAFIRRYDRAGKVLWTRQFGTGGQDYAIDVAADAGGLTVVGVTDGSFSGGEATPGVKDVFVRRYDRAGHVLWTRQFGTAVDEDAGSVAAAGGGIVVVGTTWGALEGANAVDDPDAFVRLYTRTGDVVWTRQFGTDAPDSGSAVAIDGAGITVGGGTDGDLAGTNAGPYTDAYVRRFDLGGQVLWTRQWGQVGDDQVLSAASDGTGVTVVGYTHADAEGNEPSQAFVRRYDRAGSFRWGRTFGTRDSEVAWGVAADGKALTVTGYTYGSLEARNKGSFDVFVRRYDRSGTKVWGRQFGTAGADLGMDVAADGAGFTVLGHTSGALSGASKGELDVFVRRFSR